MNKKFASRFEENKAYFDHQRDMEYLRERIASVALIIASVLVWLWLIAMVTSILLEAFIPYDECETHSVGAQVTHCEVVATRHRQQPTKIQRLIFVTGDDFSAEIEVDEKTGLATTYKSVFEFAREHSQELDEHYKKKYLPKVEVDSWNLSLIQDLLPKGSAPIKKIITHTDYIVVNCENGEIYSLVRISKHPYFKFYK